MFRHSTATLFRSSRRLLADALPKGDGDAKSKLKETVKKEAIKLLKIQIVLVPVTLLFLMWMYPAPSEKEEELMRIEYERNAGWKT
ncbi:hypothetical protein ADEAN_000406300 [Angomonas deanei]|uniref:Uncharacterized protein n=1 Tax=Angomonas deanei TaxID=59799 RepID=A0A7G2CC49_9TRYP|nr:hypothetical protein ADEAN_000406300 [Angomonas deanei]